MICCKIVTNFSTTQGKFSGLMQSLRSQGCVLWEDGCLYFADTEKNLDKKKVGNIVKKNGYSDFYIDVYSKDNEPHENDSVNGWLNDKLVKICYNECENQNQEVFRNISIGLDMLSEEIKDLSEKSKKKHRWLHR